MFCKYPSEMKKLTDEVKELRGKLPTFDDIPKLRCCRNAFQVFPFSSTYSCFNVKFSFLFLIYHAPPLSKN